MSSHINSQDWPIEVMLEEAQKFVKKESEKHPFGMRGATVMFFHTEDRLQEQEDDEDLPFLCFHSGLSFEEQFQLLKRVEFTLMKGVYRQILEEDEETEE